MKNKFLIGVLTVFAGIFVSILIFNLTNSDSNKNYNFERTFVNTELLKFENERDRLNKNSINEMFISNKSIIESVINSNSDKSKVINLFFSNEDFLKKYETKINLPYNANILLIENDFLIYRFDRRLYKFDLNNNETTEYKAKNVDISFMVSLDKVEDCYLFFGEFLENKTYKTGFFRLNIYENSIDDVKILKKSNKSFNPDIITMNSGFFQRINSNNISYTCDKNSKIFLFDDKGIFQELINTKDNTPAPKVIKNEKGDCYYSRDGLRFSNSGIFMDNKNIFVFSNATTFKDKIIIDQYSKYTKEYIKSYKLDYKGYTSNDIANVYVFKDRIILKFYSKYASFKFSRYI